MPYEKGTYLKELEAEHREGRHDDDRFDLCPVCQQLEAEEIAREEGFSSDAERQRWISAQCNKYDPELQKSIDAVFIADHREGKHGKYPSRDCPVCIEKHGITNI